MYSSLHKIDIVAQSDTGRPLLVQTDHRARDEVDAEVELSVLFALTRLLEPRRMDYPNPVVRYVAIGGELHPALARVVVATGAEAEVFGNSPDLSAVERTAPTDLAETAFTALGRRLLAEHALSADEAGLTAYEAQVAGTPGPEEDEIAYYTAVAGLAAVTGEVVRARYGGYWVEHPGDQAMPFMFEVPGRGIINAVGKAERFLAHGEAQAPRKLLAVLAEIDEPVGPILCSLKPSSWSPTEGMLTELLNPALTRSDADVPLLVYGRDNPHSFAMPSWGGLGDLDAVRAEALRNLAAVEVAVERVELEAFTIWAVQGNYFAAEKILDEAFMNRMHAEIDSPLLVAGVPARGQLLVMNGKDVPSLGTFVGLIQSIYDQNEGGMHISPTVFGISEGRVAGVVQVAD